MEKTDKVSINSANKALDAETRQGLASFALPGWFADISPTLHINANTGERTAEGFRGAPRSAELCGILQDTLKTVEAKLGISPGDRSYVTDKSNSLYALAKEMFFGSLGANSRAADLMEQLNL